MGIFKFVTVLLFTGILAGLLFSLNFKTLLGVGFRDFNTVEVI